MSVDIIFAHSFVYMEVLNTISSRINLVSVHRSRKLYSFEYDFTSRISIHNLAKETREGKRIQSGTKRSLQNAT